MTLAKVLYLVAAILFFLGLIVDFPAVLLGLGFLAAGHVVDGIL